MSTLSNKVAIVTGASKGIGAGIAAALGSEGARVAVNYSSDREGAERVAQAIINTGRKAIAVGADVSKAADVARLFKEVDSAFGRLDVLANNAGVFRFGAITDITEQSFHLHYDVNVLGTILTVQEAIKRFGPDGGSIINLSSIVGSHPVPGALLYASTKGAIETLTKGLALELAPRKIRVNAIAPGHTETEGNVAAGTFEGGAGRRSGWEDAARPARSRHRYRPAGSVPGVRRISLDHRRGHPCRRRARCGHLRQCADLAITTQSEQHREENTMQFQSDYFNAYHNLKLTRDDKGVLVAEVHSNGGPCIMTAQSHTEFVDGFYRISQDRANKIVILTGAGGEFITDVDWSSFGNAADPGVWSQVHDEGVQALENIANIRVPVVAAIEGRAHVHSDYALLASVIVAADGATFEDVAHFSQGVAPGDGIFTTWSYRAGAGRAEAFLLNPQPLTARTAYEWGVVAEVVPNGKALSRARELAELYLKAPEVTRRNTRVHFIQPLKERIVREVGYGLSLEGASAADLVKSMQAKSEPVAQKGKVA